MCRTLYVTVFVTCAVRPCAWVSVGCGFTSAQNSRHVDRKVFKMRELRGAGRVVVSHIPGESNPADLFTKILSRQPFEKHRKTVLNLSAGDDEELTRKHSSSLQGTASKTTPPPSGGDGASPSSRVKGTSKP